MPQVTVRDHALWFSHITEGDTLIQYLSALKAGDTITLEVDGIAGEWVRMDDGKDDRPTNGIKPIGEAKAHWHELLKNRGQVVSIKFVAGTAEQPANSFSESHPFAYHTFPLHAAKALWLRGGLLSKEQLERQGILLKRKTTQGIDVALGFKDFVHFYLPKARDSFTFADLPILHTQLKASDKPPFPHVLLKVPTYILDEADCTICNWNIAVSRPGVPTHNVKGGNWTRGTNTERILRVWQQFKQESPDAKRARGYWHDGFEVPVLVGDEIGQNLSFLNAAPSRCPELLIKARFPLTKPTKMYVFSETDRELLEILGPPPGDMEVELATFGGYTEQDQETVEIREVIRDYFEGCAKAIPELDFDMRR